MTSSQGVLYIYIYICANCIALWLNTYVYVCVKYLMGKHERLYDDLAMCGSDSIDQYQSTRCPSRSTTTRFVARCVAINLLCPSGAVKTPSSPKKAPVHRATPGIPVGHKEYIYTYSIKQIMVNNLNSLKILFIWTLLFGIVLQVSVNQNALYI